MGGMIVLQLAAAHSECVAAIVMVDQPHIYSPERRGAGGDGGSHRGRQ
jgi:hypothetical protein